MPSIKTVAFIHGWSAKASSFEDLANALRIDGYEPVNLYLGEYPSTDDDVRIEDVAKRMDAVVREKLGGRKFHLIVHSTGALVARQWLTTVYPKGGSPVANFIMLAPANFGSPFARIGRSLAGRIIKGIGNEFQSGTEILHALELGSELQEALALKDRLSKDGSTDSPYSANGTRPYVMVGALRVPGAQVAVNDGGWDGTVRIASAQLDPHGLTVEFSENDGRPAITPWTRRGPARTAFALLPDHHHTTITDPTGSRAKQEPYIGRSMDLIREALAVNTAAGYSRVTERWRTEITGQTRKLARSPAKDEADPRAAIFGSRRKDWPPHDRYNEHYQVVVIGRDSSGAPLEDYGVFLSTETAARVAKGRRTRRNGDVDEVHERILRKVHVNSRAPWRRVFHLDRYKLMGRDEYFDTASSGRTLYASIAAAALGDNINFGLGKGQAYGYLPLRPGTRDLPEDHPDRILRRWSTHFIEVVLPRRIKDHVFEFHQLP